MHPKKKIDDLLELVEDGIFAVYGVVTGIIGGEEWWYLACKCHKAVIPDSVAYYCNSCVKHIFQVVPRYVWFILLESML
ncbi:replication factor A protein [Trifolium medium]|uniref:Replication factor A protein n=1 Tax=Trifolium medium TaxID=97028 RepID=A0A392UAT0_9FABA|nr:replication factor A protein [Trifolium medium]